jgi:hypothetical protein
MMESKRNARWLLMLLVVLVTSVLETRLLVGEAHAIIGRPLTPMSYAGVARRTTRRAVAYGAVAAPYYGGYPAYW